jgi:hypothetical protein
VVVRLIRTNICPLERSDVVSVASGLAGSPTQSARGWGKARDYYRYRPWPLVMHTT